MATSLRQPEKTLPPMPPGALPDRMRVLLFTTPGRDGCWLSEALAADHASDVQIEEVAGPSEGAARLRDEVFDAVVISHDPDSFDVLDLAEGLRAGGFDKPLVVLGAQAEEEMAAVCFEVGADAYVCTHTCTTRSLLWIMARAIERHHLIRENRRLSHAARHRLQKERGEAEQLLEHQRAVIRDLEAIRRGETPAENDGNNENDDTSVPESPHSPPLPARLVEHYHELLRAYVIMGSGNLGTEMCRLASLLARSGLTARGTLQLHLRVVEDMIQGLGSRSSRHVMTRADQLILEVMVHLAEDYRLQGQSVECPPHQQLLPGFNPRD